jgi:hypothetical protein
MNRYSFTGRLIAVFGIGAGILVFSCGNPAKNNASAFDMMTIPVGKGPGSVEVADFNKDGFPDIVVSNWKIAL